jgi:hypothetical protein
VSLANRKITLRQSKDGMTRGRYLNIEEIKKHKYWHPDKGGAPILKSILDANRKIFEEAA